MMALLLVCALFIGQNCVEADDSDAKAIRPFPLVDIREFYNTTGYIWSFVGTDGTYRCKVDHPDYETYKEVVFRRTYIESGPHTEKRNVTLYLKGTFVDMEIRYQPTMIQVTSASSDDGHTEQMAYEDENSTCGVFLTFPQLPLANTFNYNRYHNYTLCELRKRGTKTGPRLTDACNSQFLQICKPKTPYSLYENCTKPEEVKPTERTRMIIPPITAPEFEDETNVSVHERSSLEF